MNAALLLEHYARIADAPDAIARLRRFVLDLAVRGKLVEQDANDEPASKLLTQSRGKTIKARKVDAQDSMAETPYPVPPSWEWVPVSAVFGYDAGRKVDAKSLRPDFWLLELEDVEKDTGRLIRRVRVSERPALSTKSEFAKGDILYGKLRPYLNKVIVAEEDGYSTTEIVAMRPLIEVYPPYCALAFRRPDFVEYVSRLGQGTKMPRLRREDALVAPFPLPPLAEQHRIVAKVDELMALCDQLEAVRTEREAARDTFTQSTLAKLNTPNPETFRDDARFALANLAPLTTRTDQIKQLRQTILNLAVRGKLVEQDAADEPALALFKRLTDERARLAKAGAIPRPKEAKRDPDFLTEPFPDSWLPVALGDVCNLVTSGSRGWGEFYAESGPGFIRAQNIRFGKLRLDGLACVNPPTKSEGARTQVAKGDLLVVITGAGVTNPALLNVDLGEAYVSQHVGLVRPCDPDLSRWLLLCLMADAGGRAELTMRAYGAGKPGLNLDNIRSLSIPLPPLAEQRRIVAKVNELMSLCDQLEASLATDEQTRSRLLEAVLHNALEPV